MPARSQRGGGVGGAVEEGARRDALDGGVGGHRGDAQTGTRAPEPFPVPVDGLVRFCRDPGSGIGQACWGASWWRYQMVDGWERTRS